MAFCFCFSRMTSMATMVLLLSSSTPSAPQVLRPSSLRRRLQFLSKGEKIWVVCGSAITLLLFRNAGLKHICEDGKSSYSLVPWFLKRKSQTCTPWFLGFGAKIPQGFISTVSN